MAVVPLSPAALLGGCVGVVPYQSHGLLSSLSDEELLNRLSALLKASRRVESVLIAHIGEVDARRLYAREATQSMFAYCVERLHLSEPEAYLRIAVGRAARDHPLILAMLADGRLHLSGVAKLIPHLTRENAPMLLERAAGCSKRRIEEMVPELIPRPPAADQVRRLPETPRDCPQHTKVRSLQRGTCDLHHCRCLPFVPIARNRWRPIDTGSSSRPTLPFATSSNV